MRNAGKYGQGAAAGMLAKQVATFVRCAFLLSLFTIGPGLSAGCAGYVVPKNHWSDFHGFNVDKPVFVDTDEGVVHFTVQSPLTIVDAKGEKIIARFKSISVERDTFVGRTRDGREIRMAFAQIARIEVDGKVLGEVGAIAEKKNEQRRGFGQRGAGSF